MWVATNNSRCVNNSDGSNTGEQEQEQRDTNPVSPTYNQVRWVSIGFTNAVQLVWSRLTLDYCTIANYH
jgi:hypothetical protein